MTSEDAGRPDPEAEEPERAPGGVDADVSESDVGAASEGEPVTPDAPLPAQADETEIPDELQTPEEPEVTKEPDEDGTSEPSA